MADKLKSVIFDFDGVIVDTFEALRRLTRIHDGVPLDPEGYREFFEGNVLDNGTKRKFISFHDEDVKKKFIDEYGVRLHTDHAPIPGIAEAIRDIATAYELHLVTSGPAKIIGDFLHRHELGGHFGKVLGYEIEHSKVKKFAMLGAHGTDATGHLYVTDTLGDLREAAHAGMPAIAVTWGFHDEARLKQGNPFAIVRSPDELREAINEYNRA